MPQKVRFRTLLSKRKFGKLKFMNEMVDRIVKKMRNSKKA